MTAADRRISPVVLCGGSGTRLWPLSRENYPKQFVPLLGGKSLLQLTCERAKLISPDLRAVAAEAHRFLVRECAEAAGVRVSQILEPVMRNTAPAMTLAALDSDPDELLLFLPADHYIPDDAAFAERVRHAADLAEAGRIVTFGIAPRSSSTAYGYIGRGEALPGHPEAFEVLGFIEKPDAGKAGELTRSGQYLWNSGVFLCRADALIEEMEAHAPDILAACRKAFARRSEDNGFLRIDEAAFAACRRESIDYAVMERTARLCVVTFDGQWSDVGSWTALADLTPGDASGNRTEGRAWIVNSNNTYVRAQSRPVVALGVSGLTVIETPDAVLVLSSERAEEVKTVVADMERAGIPEATRQRRDLRPWGAFDVLHTGQRFQVKHITVKPGARLSVQRHYHRAEHWIVVRGTARVTKGEDEFLLLEDQSTYIPQGFVHSLENPGKVPLEIIEIQSGEYLGEDDIERLDDNYGRN